MSQLEMSKILHHSFSHDDPDMSSFNGMTLTNIAEYPTDPRNPKTADHSQKFSSFYESERNKSAEDSFEPQGTQDEWKYKYYKLLEDREAKDRQLQETLDSLAGVVNRLENEVQILRSDRKKLSQQLDLLAQENESLKENRSSTREVIELRSMLKMEREKFQEELVELSEQLEKLQEELNKVKAKKAKQGELQKKIELTHETFMRQLEEKERRIRSLEFQNKELIELVDNENSQRPTSPSGSRPLTERARIKKRRALSTCRKSVGRLHSPKSQRHTESAKKIKHYDSLQLTAARLEDELDDIRQKLYVHANSPTRHKERLRLRSLKKKYEEELEKVQKAQRKALKGSATGPPMKFNY